MTAPGPARPDTPIAGLVELALTRADIPAARRACRRSTRRIDTGRPGQRPAVRGQCAGPAGSAAGGHGHRARSRRPGRRTARCLRHAVAVFPSWETLPHERLSPGVDTVGARLMVLRRLAHPDDARLGPPLRVVVTAVRSLLQPMAPRLGHHGTGDPARRRRDRLRRSDRPAGRAGLHPGRHGRPARRIRGPRRHSRHLRPDGRASGARRVLG